MVDQTTDVPVPVSHTDSEVMGMKTHTDQGIITLTDKGKESYFYAIDVAMDVPGAGTKTVHSAGSAETGIVTHKEGDTLTWGKGAGKVTIHSKELADSMDHAMDAILKGQFTPDEARALRSAVTMLQDSVAHGTLEADTQQIKKAFGAAEKIGNRGL